MNKSEVPGLYLHIPFCRTKCPYCDFYSVTTLASMGDWLEAVEREILLYRERFAAFDTLYLGGGTPTLLSGPELTRLMECLSTHFTFAPQTEITIEANPDDITREKLAFIDDLGINRISLGVQSFQEREISFLKRRHTAHQAARALDLIRTSGFDNIGIDLIYGFQGQSESRWVDTLKRALEFNPEHLSCYQMTLEEGTPFGKMKAEGKIWPLGEEVESSFFRLTSDFLQEHGYIHYEISNFARSPEYFSRHNQKYWHHVPYLALGPGAHSFQDGVRWWNVRSLESYCRMLQRGELPVDDSETLSPEQLRLEAVYLGLRTREGVDLEIIRKQAGADAVLRELERSGLVTVDQGMVIPTRQGFLVADSLPLLFFD